MQHDRQLSPTGLGSGLVSLCLGALLALPAGAVFAQTQLDFLIFPSVTGTRDWDREPPSDADRSDLSAAVNLFASASRDRFRFLGEWLFVEDFNEIQRLQLGWHFDSDDTVWLGRYHTPVGYWNTQYHHGTYLQTSVSRPAIVEFEGRHGPLPTHYTGLLWEGSTSAPGGAVHYALAVGLAPTLRNRLQPLDVADPDHESESGALINLSWRPAPHDDRQIGISAGRTRIHDHTGVADRVEQDLIGIYANWRWQELRLLMAGFRLSHSFAGLRAPDDDFTAGYLQGEYAFHPRWTAYGRVESTAGEQADSLYLGRISDYATEQRLLGLRLDVGTRQAVTLELARWQSFDRRGNRAMVQWSAYFP